MSGPGKIDSLLKTMKQGDAVAAFADGADPLAVFLVRERSAVIKYFGETGVEIRAARFAFGPVMVLAVGFLLGRTVSKAYAVLIDCCSREGTVILRRLGSQEYIPLYFHGDNLRRDRTFITMNRLQAFFRDTAITLQGLTPWNQEDFRAAAAALATRCPTSEELWSVMEEQ